VSEEALATDDDKKNPPKKTPASRKAKKPAVKKAAPLTATKKTSKPTPATQKKVVKVSRVKTEEAKKPAAKETEKKEEPPIKNEAFQTARHRLPKWARWVIGLGVVGMLLGALVLYTVVEYFSRDLPDVHQLAKYDPAVITRLYAANGVLLEEYAKEKRIFVPIDAMPKVLIHAFIAAEDQNFYHHPGVDFFSILRAIIQNVLNQFTGQSKNLIGASTITQQVAKNMLLSNERTMTRKVKEAILAFRMTVAFSKNRILELYLNEIYLGAGSYGVAAAALNYFNKSIDELTIEEAALLAAMPKAPSAYDPRNNSRRAKERRNWVIGRMLDEEFVDELQARNAIAEPIRLKLRDKAEIATADFFAEEVRREIAENYGKKALYEGGLMVMTTLDPALQSMAETALREGLLEYDRRSGYYGPIGNIDVRQDWYVALNSKETPEGVLENGWEMGVVLLKKKEGVHVGLKDGNTGIISYEDMKWAARNPDTGKKKDVQTILSEGDVVLLEPEKTKKERYLLRQLPKVNGGLVVMDPHTGKVKAMVGGFTYSNSKFNRATQAERQPGSAFKPFVYLDAVEKGLTPASLINDDPVEFETIAKGANDLGAIHEVWAPQNYSGAFYGPTTLRVGLEKSRNVMTVRLGDRLGIDSVIEVAKRFGINEEMGRNMASVLGAQETTLIKLTNAYAMLVNGGKEIIPSLIERIHDRNGKVTYRRDARFCEACEYKSAKDVESFDPPELPDIREEATDPYSAYQVVSMLEGVVKRGTGTKARVIGKPLAGKTGTTNKSKDTWFVGFSPDLVAGVYVGFDTPKSLGGKESGSSVALPVWVKFMEAALKKAPSTPFRIPSGIKLVKIDRKTGFLPSKDTPKGDIILEAFKPGTEPKISITRTEALPAAAIAEEVFDRDTDKEGNHATSAGSGGSREQDRGTLNDPRLRDNPALRGTGGIY
jgi:penicillin-binding protein 1A